MMPNTPIMAANQEKSKIYGITMMPHGRYASMEGTAVFGTVQRRIVLRWRYLMTAFLYALRGVSHTVTSRDFVCRKSPNHSRTRLSLWGHSPQSPDEKECDVYGEGYTNCRKGYGKGERKNLVQSPKMRAEYNRICEAKSVGVRAENGSARRSFCLP